MDSPVARAETSSSALHPTVVRSGESLTGSPIRFVGKETFVKLAADFSSCSISILEDVSPAHHGPPLHAHEFEEFFYILSGEFLFEVDGDQISTYPEISSTRLRIFLMSSRTRRNTRRECWSLLDPEASKTTLPSLPGN